MVVTQAQRALDGGRRDQEGWNDVRIFRLLMMDVVNRWARAIDGWQRRHRPSAFLFAVFKKFGDDQGGNLVALLTYFAFLATFPLLLALTGILGLALQGQPGLENSIKTSALSEFPIIGSQITSQTSGASLPHSGVALAIGLIGSILGGRGLANAFQNVANSVWNVPMRDRPGFPVNLLRTLGLLGLLFLGAILTAGVTALAGQAHLLGAHGEVIRAIGILLSCVVDIGLFWAAFRLATAPLVKAKDLLLGAIVSAVAWQVLLARAGLIINHQLRHSQAVAGFFGIVLGMLAWFGLQATVTVYSMELDVVRIRKLWPRSLVQPPLTDADKNVLRDMTEAETRRPEQEVAVTFSKDNSGRR